MKPKLTVSGYRGIWGESLTIPIANEFVDAFSAFVKNYNGSKILIGRDARESGKELSGEIITRLIQNGFTVVDLGIMPTPVVLFLVKNQKADGAIIITASHNPIEYNGLKFVTSSGLFTNEADVAEITQLLASTTHPKETIPGTRIDGSHLFDLYLETLLTHIDIELIKSKNFSVALDPINSVGCTTTPKLLDALGVTYSVINGEPNGKFGHIPEPLPKNLTDLQNLVQETKSAIGFAQDPDGDRLVICDEQGIIPTEETMLALCVKAVLVKNSGTVVINLSTSSMSADLATHHGAKTIRSKVGEANVVQAMIEHNAIVGGEGSGGIIYPTINTARDSFVGIALILELMAHENKPLSEIIAELPHYEMAKEKISFTGDLPSFYTNIKNCFPEAKAYTTDGLRLDFPDQSWVHIRPSNTEPVLRIIAEAKTTTKATDLIQKVKNVLE